MNSEIIERRFIPGLKTVLHCKKSSVFEKIWDFFWEWIIGMRFEIWYFSICFMCYFVFFIYKIIGPISDVPIIYNEYNLFDLLLFIGIILTIPVIIIYFINAPRRNAYKQRTKKCKQQEVFPEGASPGSIKTDGNNLYFEHLTAINLMQDFTTDSCHELITKIEIYEEKYGRKSELRMHIYYLEYWNSKAERVAEADGSLENVTDDTIRDLLKFENVINKSNFM